MTFNEPHDRQVLTAYCYGTRQMEPAFISCYAGRHVECGLYTSLDSRSGRVDDSRKVNRIRRSFPSEGETRKIGKCRSDRIMNAKMHLWRGKARV